MPVASHRVALAELLRVVPRRRLAATAAVLLGLSVTEGFGVLLLLPLLQLVGVDAGTGGTAPWTDAVGAAFARAGVTPSVGAVLIVYVAIAAAHATLQRWQTLVGVRTQQDIVAALRRRLYDAMTGLEWIRFARRRASDLTHVLTEEVDRAGSAASYLIDLLVAAAIALVYFGLAFQISPLVTSVVAGFGIALAVSLRHRLRSAWQRGAELSRAGQRLYGAITESIGSMKTAISYGAEGRHAELVGHLADDVRDARLRAAGEQARFRQRLMLATTAGLAGIVYVALDILSLPTAELLVLLFLFARLVPRLTGLYERGQAVVSQLPAVHAVVETERGCLVAARPIVAGRRPVDFASEIRLEGVSFHYGDEARPAVRAVTMSIAAGATTAIVGPSGAGKSTIADLLLGLLTPTAGRVLVDGAALGPDALDAWRAQIGYVPQDTFLFHDTVRANLRWACPEAGDEDLWRALHLAAAGEFVAAIPAGLDTVVGDRGVLLSGGERQRLSLARALLRRPRLLILDEATSALDSESEARIQRAIEDLHRQLTIVVITHRLSTVRHADRVHVVDRGELVESGSWDALSAGSGRFRDLLLAQGLAGSGPGRRRGAVLAPVS